MKPDLQNDPGYQYVQKIHSDLADLEYLRQQHATDAMRILQLTNDGREKDDEIVRLQSELKAACYVNATLSDADKSSEGFDWAVLGKIDELQREVERLQSALADTADTAETPYEVGLTAYGQGYRMIPFMAHCDQEEWRRGWDDALQSARRGDVRLPGGGGGG